MEAISEASQWSTSCKGASINRRRQSAMDNHLCGVGQRPACKASRSCTSVSDWTTNGYKICKRRYEMEHSLKTITISCTACPPPSQAVGIGEMCSAVKKHAEGWHSSSRQTPARQTPQQLRSEHRVQGLPHARMHAAVPQGTSTALSRDPIHQRECEACK